MRAPMKSPPFSDKENYRAKILSAAIRRVKLDREKNIYRLRNGIEDFNGLAKEILSSPCEAISLFSPPRGSTDAAILGRNSSGDISELVSDSRYNGDFGDSSENDEAALIHYLGSEDHELLMTQIAEALQEEYFTDLNDGEMFLHESQEQQESCYWLQEESQLDQDAIVICPVCRVSHLDIIGSFGDCVCGVAIDLRDKRTGEVMTAGGLKDRLADVYNRHIEVCNYDMRVSPLSLGWSADRANVSYREGVNDSSDDLDDSMRCRDGSCSRVILIANCAFCGFDEIVL